MKALVLLLLLCACSATGVTRSVNLTISNDTGRPERIRATVEDVGRHKELFSRTALLLPGGAEELGEVAEVENATMIRVCSTLVAYPDKDAHVCRVYRVVGRDAQCMAAAFSLTGKPPYASVSCWDMYPREEP